MWQSGKVCLIVNNEFEGIGLGKHVLSEGELQHRYFGIQLPKPLLLLSSEDQRISGSFASNKGRLPIPVAGGYRIVSRYGQYNVEGLKNVRLDNKGLNIQGAPGAQVRSIFDGEVSAVFNVGGSSGVMVRHGSYISVYCNLGSVFVRRGQKVSTRQPIGTLGPDNVLQFQLRKEKTKLNPELWLGR